MLGTESRNRGRTWQFPLKQATEKGMRNEKSVRWRYKMAETEGSAHKLLDNIAELRERERERAKGSVSMK